MKKILVLITARGSSKRVLNKNIKLLAGKPLITYSIEVALKLKNKFYRVIVSTDSDEIATISLKAGAEVPFIRPTELAQDDTPSLLVLQHAARFIEEKENIILDWVMLLQPTSPLRTEQDLEKALSLSEIENTSSVISVVEANDYHPLKMYTIENEKLSPYSNNYIEGRRSQDFCPEIYKTNGSIYLVQRDTLMIHNSLIGDSPRAMVMPKERSIDIDTEFDILIAEALLSTKKLQDVQ